MTPRELHLKRWAMAVVLIVSILGVAFMGARAYHHAPPIPDFVGPDGAVVVPRELVLDGQVTFQRRALMDYGSMFGDGAGRGPDFTADALHQLALAMQAHHRAELSALRGGALTEIERAGIEAAVKAELKANRHDPARDVVRLTAAQAAAFPVLVAHYGRMFAPPGTAPSRPFVPAATPTEIRELTAFFYWGAWVCSTARPGQATSYTHDWPYDPTAGNVPGPAVMLWSVLGLLGLILGVGAVLFARGRMAAQAGFQIDARDGPVVTAASIARFEPTPGQRATYKFFVVAAVLFVLQVGAGVLTVHDFLGFTTFFGVDLAAVVPITIARSWHLQWALFWVVACWIGASIFVLPLLTGDEPRGQARLVDGLFALVLVMVVGSAVGIYLGPTGWLGAWWHLLGNQGWEFVELGKLWQVLLFGALAMWCAIIFRGIAPAARRWDPSSLPSWLGYTILIVLLLFVSGFIATPRTNFVITDFWRWCVIHMWVEAFLEVFTTIMVAAFMVLMGLASRRSATQVVFLSAMLFLGAGILGISHNFYWNAKPVETLAIGSVFSTLQVVPLLLLALEAWKTRQLPAMALQDDGAAGAAFGQRAAFLFLLGVSFWNFFGAGVLGLIINLPIMNYYEHGTYLTVNHGHAAFMGVYGNLSLAAMIFCCRHLVPADRWAERPLVAAFWSQNVGLMLMVLLDLFPVGLLQFQATLEHGLWYSRSLEFVGGPTFQLLTWLRAIGGYVFTFGGVFPIAWFLLTRRPRRAAAAAPPLPPAARGGAPPPPPLEVAPPATPPAPRPPPRRLHPLPARHRGRARAGGRRPRGHAAPAAGHAARRGAGGGRLGPGGDRERRRPAPPAAAGRRLARGEGRARGAAGLAEAPDGRGPQGDRPLERRPDPDALERGGPRGDHHREHGAAEGRARPRDRACRHVRRGGGRLEGQGALPALRAGPGAAVPQARGRRAGHPELPVGARRDLDGRGPHDGGAVPRPRGPAAPEGEARRRDARRGRGRAPLRRRGRRRDRRGRGPRGAGEAPGRRLGPPQPAGAEAARQVVGGRADGVGRRQLAHVVPQGRAPVPHDVRREAHDHGRRLRGRLQGGRGGPRQAHAAPDRARDLLELRRARDPVERHRAPRHGDRSQAREAGLDGDHVVGHRAQGDHQPADGRAARGAHAERPAHDAGRRLHRLLGHEVRQPRAAPLHVRAGRQAAPDRRPDAAAPVVALRPCHGLDGRRGGARAVLPARGEGLRSTGARGRHEPPVGRHPLPQGQRRRAEARRPHRPPRREGGRGEGLVQVTGPAMKTIIEPFRIKCVEPIRMTTRAEREAALAAAGWNLFNLPAELVLIDLLTDSGTGAMSAEQWAGLMRGDESYAGGRSFARFEEVVRGLTGMPHVLPTHQGRAAERILFSLVGGPGKLVPNNTHFDTTRANVEFTGAEARDFVIPEGRVPALVHPFKGEMDVGALVAAIEAHGPANVPLVMLTVTNNSAGGQPVSLANIRAVKAALAPWGIPLFLDAARFAENAWFIKQREPGQGDRPVRDIAREMFDLADGCTMSAKKDGLAHIGGFLALRDDALAERARHLLILTEGFPSYGGLAGRDLEAIAQGLHEVLDEDYLRYRTRSVAYLGEAVAAAGVPIMQPPGGHAVYVDAAAMLPHLPPGHYPGQALACALYLEAGIRTVEIGSVMFGKRRPDGGETPAAMELLRLAIPRRVYTQSHVDYLAEALIAVHARRDGIGGLRMTNDPPFLRHFTARFEALPMPASAALQAPSGAREPAGG